MNLTVTHDSLLKMKKQTNDERVSNDVFMYLTTNVSDEKTIFSVCGANVNV